MFRIRSIRRLYSIKRYKIAHQGFVDKAWWFIIRSNSFRLRMFDVWWKTPVSSVLSRVSCYHVRSAPGSDVTRDRSCRSWGHSLHLLYVCSRAGHWLSHSAAHHLTQPSAGMVTAIWCVCTFSRVLQFWHRCTDIDIYKDNLSLIGIYSYSLKIFAQ